MSEGVDVSVPLKLPDVVVGGEVSKPTNGQVEVGGEKKKPTLEDVREMNRATSAYDKLGVEKGATQAEIKTAYFDVMKLIHPDVNTDPAMLEMAKEYNLIYEQLSKPENRRKYDQQEAVAQAAKAEAARAATGFTSNEKMNPAEFVEARKWAGAVVDSMDSTQLDEVKRHAIEAAAVAHEKGMVNPEQFNYIMGHTITTDFLQMVPNERTQLLLQSAAEKNAGNPEALLLLLLLIMALLMAGAADLISDDTDGFLEKVAMALAIGGMAAVVGFVELSRRKKEEKSAAQKQPVTRVVEENGAIGVIASGEAPAQLEANSLPQLPAGEVNIGAMILPTVMVAAMRQREPVHSS